ncbi:hypothetical protein [Saccharopolyspora sp. NPDC002376]
MNDLHLPLDVNFTDPDGQQTSRTGFCVPEDHWEWFSQVLARTTAAALLAFAGDRGSARELLTGRQKQRMGSEHSRVSAGMWCDTGIKLGGLPFVGTDYVFRLHGRRVEVFSGLAKASYRLLKDHDLEGHETALPGLLASWRRVEDDIARAWGGVVRSP